jgi:serine/threonine-protein kinase
MDPPSRPNVPGTRAATPNLPAADVDLSGKVLGDFQLVRRLGQGGMGQVYLAEQLSLKRKVALKLLRPEMAANTTALLRFKKEAEAVARATHANIVQVYAIGEAEGHHYMALEYVEGRTLREYIEKKGPPEVLIALSIMRQVASALQRASELGVIHRDVKPDNILLTRKGEAKVADFGLYFPTNDQEILRLTQSGVTLGTPLYMSPEQVEGRTVDPRTDIYSLGVTCYHMLTGEPPYRGQTAFEVAFQHIQGTPRPLSEIRPDLPAELCAIVHKMMARLPEQRHQTAREIVKEVALLRDALVGVMKTGPMPLQLPTSPIAVSIKAPSTATMPRPILPRRSPRWLRWAGVLSIVVAFVLGGVIGWLRNSSRATAAIPDQTTDKSAPEESISPRREREQLLRAQWQRYAQPTVEQECRLGLQAAVDLGLFFLDVWRLEDAEEWFKQLDSPDRHLAYRLFGQLGRAIVRAFQDRSTESRFLFLKVLPQDLKKRAPRKATEADKWLYYMLRTYPQLRLTIAQALDRNYENNKETFPARLQPLRKPPPDPLQKPRGRG